MNMVDADKKVADFLDDLSGRALDLYQMADRVADAIRLFPEIDWPAALEAAADRQVERNPEANSMDGLADLISDEERKAARRRRRALKLEAKQINMDRKAAVEHTKKKKNL